jgi:hypothetical protein
MHLSLRRCERTYLHEKYGFGLLESGPIEEG